MLNLEPRAIRYLETEFKQITSLKSKNGQRLYKKPIINKISKIKNLLLNEGLTVVEAKRILPCSSLLNIKLSKSELISENLTSLSKLKNIAVDLELLLSSLRD